MDKYEVTWTWRAVFACHHGLRQSLCPRCLARPKRWEEPIARHPHVLRAPGSPTEPAEPRYVRHYVEGGEAVPESGCD